MFNPRRFQVVSFNKLPPAAAFLPQMVSNLSLTTLPIVIAALGTQIKDDHRVVRPPTAFTSFYGALELTRTLGTNGKFSKVDAGDDDRNAAIMVELISGWAYEPEGITLDRVTTSRIKLHQLIDTLLIDNPTINITIANSINIMVNNIGVRVTRQQIHETLDIPLNTLGQDEYPMCKLLWFALRLNCLPANRLLTSAQFREQKEHMENWNDNNDFNPLEVRANYDDNPALLWPTWGLREKLTYFEMKGRCDAKENDNWAMASVVAWSYTITKQGTITPNWLQSRIKQLVEKFPDLQLGDIITSQVLKLIIQKTPLNNINSDYVARSMLAMYSMYSESAVECLQWNIEQGVVNHITPAQCFAEAITKASHPMLDILRTKINELQFAKLAELTGDLYYNRFCCVLKPTVEVQEYADLGYMGIYISLTELGKKTTAYAGSIANKADHPKSVLESWARAIIEQNRQLAMSGMELIDIARKTFPEGVIWEVNNRYFFDTAADNNPPLVAEGAQPNADTVDAQLRTLREQRQDWPRTMRNLPASVKEISLEELGDKLVATQSAWAKALRRVLALLYDLTKQSVLPTLRETVVNPSQWKSKLTNNLLNDLTALQVTIKPEWTQDPPLIPDVLVNNAITMHNFYLPTRENINIDEIVAVNEVIPLPGP